MNQDRKENTGHGFRKFKIAVFSIILVFVVAVATYAMLGGSSSKNSLVSTFFAKEKINILVLGVDIREDDVGRSDTTFVLTLDTKAKKMTMFSIPRDTRMKIDGHGWDKINHAFAFGGAKLSKSTLENFLDISIDYTVMMNIQGFVRMIDALGGVTIDVEKRMHYSDPYDDNGGLYIDLYPGVQKMNGKTAIQYVRFRDEEGDIGRVERQQKFLKALVHEFSKPQLITKLPDLLKEFATTVKTDMPSKEMIKLIPIISDMAKTGLQTESLTGTPGWIQEISYWLPDIREMRRKVAQIQGISMDSSYTQGTERQVSEYSRFVPTEMKVVETATPETKRAVVEDKKTVDTTTKTPTKPNGITVGTVPPKPKTTDTSTTGRSSTDVPATSKTSSSQPTDTSANSGKTTGSNTTTK